MRFLQSCVHLCLCDFRLFFLTRDLYAECMSRGGGFVDREWLMQAGISTLTVIVAWPDTIRSSA